MDTNATLAPDFGTLLLGHLGRLLADPSRLDSFRHWFTRALWDAESGDDELPDDIRDLAYRVENLLGVYDAGAWSAERLIAELGAELHARMFPTFATDLAAALRTRREQVLAGDRPAA